MGERLVGIWQSVIEHVLGWPVAALVLGLIFRKPLIELVGRINNIKAPGIELTAPPASAQLKEAKERPESLKGEIVTTIPEPPALPGPVVSSDSELEKKREAVRNYGNRIPGIEENIKNIRAHLEYLKMPVGPDETSDVLVRQLAVTQLMVRCERTHRAIFGSQIVALHLMNNGGPQTESALEPLFENARKQEPHFYGSYTFVDWIGFLIKEGATTHEGGLYAITIYGKSYLGYIGLFAIAPKPH